MTVDPSPSVSWPRLCLYVFGLTLLLRIGLWSQAIRDETNLYYTDADQYHRIAVILIEDHVFASVGRQRIVRDADGTLRQEDGKEKVPDNFRTPGYPLFLAAVYSLFGIKPRLALLIQALLVSAFTLVVMNLTRFVGGWRAGLAAGALLSLDVSSLAHSSVLYSDPMMALFPYTSVALLLVAVERCESSRRSAWLALGAGLAMSWAILVRPGAMYLPFVLAAAAVASAPSSRRLALGGIFLVASASLVSVWCYRNLVVLGGFEISSNEADFMLRFTAAGVVAQARNLPPEQLQQSLLDESLAEAKKQGLDPAGARRLMKEHARAYIKQYPVEYARLLLTGSLRTYGGTSGQLLLRQLGLRSGIHAPTRQDQFSVGSRLRAVGALGSGLMVLELVVRGFVLVAALVGCWVLARERRFTALVLLAVPVLYFSLTFATIAPETRFRLPLDPFLFTLAAIAFSRRPTGADLERRVA